MKRRDAPSGWHLDLETHGLATAGADPIPRRVALAAEREVITEGRTVEIADYARRRVVRINRGAGTYSDRSLLATMSFRYAEFHNRLYIGQVLDAGGADKDEHRFTPLMSRHDLAQGDRDHLDELERDGRPAPRRGGGAVRGQRRGVGGRSARPRVVPAPLPAARSAGTPRSSRTSRPAGRSPGEWQ